MQMWCLAQNTYISSCHMVDIGHSSRFFNLIFCFLVFFRWTNRILFRLINLNCCRLYFFFFLEFNIRLTNIYVPYLDIFVFIFQIEVQLANIFLNYFESMNFYVPFLGQIFCYCRLFYATYQVANNPTELNLCHWLQSID